MILYPDVGLDGVRLGDNVLDLFMLTHYRVLNGRNLGSTLKNGKIINLGHEDSHIDESVKLKSLGMWFNDQPSNDVKPKTYPTKKLEDSELKAKNFKWKFAHSKFVLALEVNEKKFTGGYMIDHSIPQSPHGQKYRYTEWNDKDRYPGMKGYAHRLNDGWEFFGTNGKAKAQHLSCFNFDSSEVESVLHRLSRTLPKPVLSTLSSKHFPDLLDPHHAQLVGDFFTPENTLFSAQVCLEAWNRNRALFSPWKLLTLITPECTQSMDIQSGLIKLISHSPTPHAKTLPKDKDEQELPKAQVAPEQNSNSMEEYASTITKEQETPTREVYATFFGPIPWKVTANILQTQLYISTWTNIDLPTITQQNIGVYLGDGFKVEGQHYQREALISDKSWNRGQSHEKIGIALRKSNENKYWTCIADGNHRTSEISHAGATICISSENLWKAVTSRLRSIGGSYSHIGRVAQDPKNSAPLDIKIIAEKTKYTPVFRWHIANREPSKERKTSGEIGLPDIFVFEDPKLKKRPNADVEKREDDGDDETNTLPPKAKKSKKRER
jgi:hypothetical protein